VALSVTAEGARLRFSVDVRDEQYAPARDARIRLTLTEPSGAEREIATSWQDGTRAVAEAQFDARESGEHKVRVVATRGPVALGAAETWTLVGGADQEFVLPLRDDETLRRVAEASGGRLVAPEDLPRIATWLREATHRPVALAQREIWQTPWVLAAIFAALGTEWTLRRRWGLR
jgi:hypothetical protein